jgi:hypothetical protein
VAIKQGHSAFVLANTLMAPNISSYAFICPTRFSGLKIDWYNADRQLTMAFIRTRQNAIYNRYQLPRRTFTTLCKLTERLVSIISLLYYWSSALFIFLPYQALMSVKTQMLVDLTAFNSAPVLKLLSVTSMEPMRFSRHGF